MTKPAWADFRREELLSLIDAMAIEFWIDPQKLKILALNLQWDRKKSAARDASAAVEQAFGAYARRRTSIAFERYQRASADAIRADCAATTAFDELMAAYRGGQQ